MARWVTAGAGSLLGGKPDQRQDRGVASDSCLTSRLRLSKFLVFVPLPGGQGSQGQLP
jgi:hypothetical protein